MLGGLLGILMMIPLRRALIVDQHGMLKYPEGTACAEVLKAGASAESRVPLRTLRGEASTQLGISARNIFAGFGIGLPYKALNIAFKGWKDASGVELRRAAEGVARPRRNPPELLGVGCIIGPRVAAMDVRGRLHHLPAADSGDPVLRPAGISPGTAHQRDVGQ